MADHEKPTFATVKTTYELVDIDKTRIAVVWEHDKPQASGMPPAYTVTVRATSGSLSGKIYSLLTFGFQAHGWTNEITALPANAEILKEDPPGSQNFVSTGTLRLQPTGTKAVPGGRDVPIESAIWFVRFNAGGTFTFKVGHVDRPLVGYTTWEGGAIGTGHDNEPPKNPPD